jgi:branched-chain amino acid transport system substrate-binding protein
LCKDWINAKGGITVNGQKYLINIIGKDTKSSAEGAVTAAQELVFQNKVKFVIGQPTPAEVEAVRSITDPNKVVYMAACNDSPDPKFPYTFTAIYPYKWPKTPLYDYLVKTYPNAKTVAVFNQDEGGNMASGAEAIAQIQKHGLTLGEHMVYPFNTEDYLPVVTKLVATKPDAIDQCLNMPSHAALVVKDARQLGYTGPIMGGSPWDPGLELSQIGANYATDFFWPSFDPTAPENKSQIPSQMTEVMKLWDNAYHVPFVLDCLQGWDSLWCLTQAIEKAQSLDPDAVVKAFENMKTIETGYGTATIGGLKTYGINGVVCESIPITRLQNGKTEFEGWFKLQIP